MKRNIKPIIIGVTIGGLTAIIGPFIVVGRLPYTEVVFFSAAFLGLPITLVSLILLVSPRIRTTIFPWIGFGIMTALILSLLGYYHADKLKWAHNHRAKQYCESLIPILETYKSEHGEYPNSIDEILPSVQPINSIYLKRQFYWKKTNDFTFGWFDSPGFPMCTGSSYYNHQEQQWGGCACW